MHYTPEEEDRIRAEIDAAKAGRSSASALSETACQPRSLALATGSLPVSPEEFLTRQLAEVRRWRDERRAMEAEARRLNDTRMEFWAQGFADALDFTTVLLEAHCEQMGWPTERQPEENT